MTQKNCKLNKIREKNTPNFKVKIGKNDQTWWVQIDDGRNPSDVGFDPCFTVESNKWSFETKWNKATIRTLHLLQGIGKDEAIKHAEALMLAVKYAIEMDDAHGINY